MGEARETKKGMTFAARWIRIALVAVLVLGLAGCAKLKARDELNKGVRAFKGGNIEGAIEHFKTSLESDPDLMVAQLYLATAVASRFIPGATSDGNKAIAHEAIAEFEKVLEVDPDDTIALRNIASLYFNLYEMDKARETRRRLLEIDPENPEHYYSIGVINWTVAFERRKAVRVQLGIMDKPDRPLPRRRARQLARDNGEIVDEGIDALTRARELNPNDWQAATYLNLMYREKADIVTDAQEREDLLHRADVLAEEALRLQLAPAEEEEGEPSA